MRTSLAYYMMVLELHMMIGQYVVPGDAQTEPAIESWMIEHAHGGTIIVVRTVEGDTCEYYLSMVERVSLADRRVVTREFGAFHCNGRKFDHPNSDTRMLIPMDDVLKAAILGEVWFALEKLDFSRTLSEDEKKLAAKLSTSGLTASPLE